MPDGRGGGAASFSVEPTRRRLVRGSVELYRGQDDHAANPSGYRELQYHLVSILIGSQ